MTDEAKQARNAYLRAWRKANPEKFQAQIDRYWERRAQRMKFAESAEPDKPTHNEPKKEETA